MNDSDIPLKHNPFEKLGTLLKVKAVPRPAPIQKTVVEPVKVCSPSENEESAFREAMVGVRPMARDKQYAEKRNVAKPPNYSVAQPEEDIRLCLDKLVKCGEGFIISQTPEYMEGTGRDIPAVFAERLHRGDFSIQTHIDLHGLGVEQAKEAFGNFLNAAIRSGKRAVLIIHGRGISSPGEPVLKNKVSEWLTRSHWRKWVIAFTSAQSYDGGAGATYVLLRHRLNTKRPKKEPAEK
jgi:DNA-nicking Smr family endonuclease